MPRRTALLSGRIVERVLRLADGDANPHRRRVLSLPIAGASSAARDRVCGRLAKVGADMRSFVIAGGRRTKSASSWRCIIGWTMLAPP